MFNVILNREDRIIGTAEQSYAACLLASVYSVRYSGEVTVYTGSHIVAKFNAGRGEWTIQTGQQVQIVEDAMTVVCNNR